jgi:hypothetical protein
MEYVYKERAVGTTKQNGASRRKNPHRPKAKEQ